MANGHGGERRNAGRRPTAPRVVAQRLMDAAVAYCQGVAGDPAGSWDLERAWERYLSQVRHAGDLAAKADLRQAVQVSFQMLDRSASTRITEDAGDGLSALMLALQYGSSVHDRSESEDIDMLEQATAGLSDVGAPDSLSGGLADSAQLGLFEAVDGAAAGGAAAAEGGAPLPPLPAPPLVSVSNPQNLDFFGAAP